MLVAELDEAEFVLDELELAVPTLAVPMELDELALPTEVEAALELLVDVGTVISYDQL